MFTNSEYLQIELLYTIVNDGMGKKILKKAKSHGVMGGTIMLGKGTVNNRLLDYLGLSDVRKEIVIMLADRETALNVADILNIEYEFEKPNHGIAFTTSICGVMGNRNYRCDHINEERGVEEHMYHVINVVVDKGRAEDAVDAATKAGAKGGTIINARGSGIHETSKVFSMDIEPEKEIVIILSEADKTEAIATAIRDKLKIEEPGNGIIYIQDTNRTYGIYK